MSVQVETLEKSMAKLTIEVSAEEFETALDKAYKKNKNKISLPHKGRGNAFSVFLCKNPLIYTE